MLSHPTDSIRPPLEVPQFIIQEAFHAPKELTKGDFELGLLRGNC